MAQWQPSLRKGLAARAVAMSLCLPLLGGQVTARIIDSLIYPHGACCCTRAHGHDHYCRCAHPPDSVDGDAAEAGRDCPSQWEEGGEEFSEPGLISVQPTVLALKTELSRTTETVSRTLPEDGSFEPGLRAAPPVPPPIRYT